MSGQGWNVDKGSETWTRVLIWNLTEMPRMKAHDRKALDDLIAERPYGRRRRCKLRGGPRELTGAMIDFARRLAIGEEVFAAGRECKFRRRACRALLASPVFVAFYLAIQHHRSPSLEALRHAARPRDRWTDPSFRPADPAQGYAIRFGVNP